MCEAKSLKDCRCETHRTLGSLSLYRSLTNIEKSAYTFIMDIEMLTNLLKLTSKDNPSLSKQLKLIKTVLDIKDKGMDNDNALKLLSEINPKLSPMVAILKSLTDKPTDKNGKTEDFVQFNHF